MAPTAEFKETPDTIHGRLLEAVHISGYTFERACSELDWLLEDDRWRKVGPGFENINDFLSTIDLSEFRIAIEERKELAKKLAEAKASQRQIGRSLGVDKRTVGRDLNDGASAPPAEPELAPEKGAASTDGAHAPPEQPWTSDPDIDPAQLAKQRAKRKEKEREREEKREENRKLIAETPPLATVTEMSETYSTIVLDPAWDYREEGDQDVYGRTRPTYGQMTTDEICALPVADIAAENAHVYLWITNRSLATGKGWYILEEWGFRPITIVTWCKTQIGVGNYFRNNTEHVLFGVRGSLPLLERNMGTHFTAQRPKRHSEKPEAFYQLVEKCSPGPWLEMFQRRERPGWVGWGAEAGSAA